MKPDQPTTMKLNETERAELKETCRRTLNAYTEAREAEEKKLEAPLTGHTFLTGISFWWPRSNGTKSPGRRRSLTNAEELFGVILRTHGGLWHKWFEWQATAKEWERVGHQL
jgi:hypothetical protein